MVNVLVALLIGVMVGLLGRPILDAYVLWRMHEVFRADRSAPVEQLTSHNGRQARRSQT